MSYQSFSPVGMPPAAPAPPVPAKKGRGLKVLGLVLLVAGIGAGAAVFILQKGQHEDSVKNLARAVPGFDNTLQFDQSGTFNVYYEYEGTVSANVSGKQTSIPLNGPTDPPSMDVTMVDKDAKKVSLTSVTSTARYDVAGYKGVAFKTVDIAKAGQFTLSIVPKDPKNITFDLALGKTAIEDPSLLLPILLAAGGLLIGGLLIIAGSRKPKGAPVPSAAFGQEPAVFGGYQQPGYQQPVAPYGGQQQPAVYPPAPYGGPPTYQQPSQPPYEPSQPYVQPPPYGQQPSQPSYEPTQPYVQQPPPPYGQQPPQPYGYPNPQDPEQKPPPPPSRGWAAPESPPAG